MVAPLPGMAPPPPDPSMMPPMGGPAPLGQPTGMSPAGPPPVQAPPPEPAPEEELPDVTPKDIILGQLKVLVDRLGEDEVRSVIAAMPATALEQLREWQMDDPVAAQLLDRILPPEEVQPLYDPNYDPSDYPRPELEWVTSIAKEDFDEWGIVREQISDNLKRFHLERAAHYRNYNDKQDDLWAAGDLSAEINAIAAMIGGTPVAFDFPALENAIREDAQKAEDAAAYWFECTQRDYRKRGNNSIQRDVALYVLLTGWVMARTGLNLEGGQKKPFNFDLVNPATTVPTWDGDGLERVTQVYQTTIGSAISGFRIKGQKKSDLLKGSENARRRKEDLVEVITYDDRRWRVVLVDGQEVVRAEHKYGACPWLIVGSGLGEPMQIELDVDLDLIDETVIATGGGVATNMGRMHKKHVSWYHFTKREQDQKEMVLQKLFNMWGRAEPPFYAWMYDDTSASKGMPNVPTGFRVVPMAANHEQLALMQNGVDPSMFGPLLQSITVQSGATRLPSEFLGTASGANQSGNAMEGVLESGMGVKVNPIIQACETFFADLGELWLKMWRDFGHLYKGYGDEYGQLLVPYQSRRARRGEEPSFQLVPEVIRRTGTEIRCKMTQVRVQNLGPLGNAISVWMGQGLMSKREALEFRGVTDPDDTLDEIQYDQIMADPELQKLVKYQTLKEFNPEFAEIYRESMLKKQQPQPGLGMPVQPGMQAGGPPPFSPNTSAVNLQGYGLGQQGPTGRPPGPGLPGPPPPPPGSMVLS